MTNTTVMDLFDNANLKFEVFKRDARLMEYHRFANGFEFTGITRNYKDYLNELAIAGPAAAVFKHLWTYGHIVGFSRPAPYCLIN
jgi:hypothetical protein